MTETQKRLHKNSQNPLSERKTDKEVNTDGDDLKEAREDAAKAGCNCSPGSTLSGKCQPLCRTVTLFEQSQSIIKNAAAMSKQINPQSERQQRAEVLHNKLSGMNNSYQNLVRAYCTEGKTDDGCDGKEGTFAKIKNTMETRFKQVDEVCNKNGDANAIALRAGAQAGMNSAMNVMSAQAMKALQADTKAGEAKAETLGNLPIASAPTANLPKANEGGGFFRFIGDALSKAVEGVKSFFK